MGAHHGERSASRETSLSRGQRDGPEPSEPPISICEITTLPASFDDDLRAYRAAPVGGIGLVESKLDREPQALTKLRESGLAATHCIPAVPSILPSPIVPGPSDPRERVERLCASVRRFAEFSPNCVVCVTGPDPDQQALVLDGLRRISDAASEAGVTVALEPGHPSLRDGLTFVHSIEAAVELLYRAGTASVGILFDTWHLWDCPGVLDQIAEHRHRIAGVHVSDWREPTRSPFDRALPGRGRIQLGPLLRQLDECGYSGYYDIEIFSDNGLIADAFPDSLWASDPSDVARWVRAGFLQAWESR